MLKVTFVFETRFTDLMLRGIFSGVPNKRKCLIFGNITKRLSNSLKRREVKVIRRKGYSKAQREEFLREYIDLIGLLGAEQNSLLWWAMDISSKNRFTSKLFLQLQQYIEIIDAIKNEGCEHLIIFNPLTGILSALEKYLGDRQITFSCSGGLVKMWVKHIAFKIRKILSVLYNAGRFYVRGLYARWHLRKSMETKLISGQPGYVIKTFIYDHSFAKSGEYKDAFFGSLPEYLSKTKRVLIFANILGGFRYCVQKIKKCPGFPVVPVEYYITASEVLKGVRLALSGGIKIEKPIMFFRYDVTEIVQERLENPYVGIQAGQLLHYWGTKGLLRRIAPENFLLSYENNPWEKMCMMALREDSPQTKIIAYQHNVVPQASTNMFVSHKEKAVIPKPDMVLTTGDIPKKIMESYGSLNGGTIRPSCALRQEYLFRIQERPYKRVGTILLGLEGIFEVYELINYVIDELHSYPDYRIVIRTHPVFPFERLQHKVNSKLHHLNNVHLSEGRSLQQDIEDSDIVIYWGSTVAMEALWMGKPGIHFDNGSVLSFDPLFDCSHLKWTVSKEDRLIETLRAIESLTPEQYEDEKANARAYLEKYFFPVVSDRLNQFVC
jgi:hypothetical protein